MALKTELDGMDDLDKLFQKLVANPEDFDKDHTIPFDDLFTDDFMQAKTNFATFDEFVRQSGFDMTQFPNIDEDALDLFITENTKFSNFRDMLSTAEDVQAAKQVDLDTKNK